MNDERTWIAIADRLPKEDCKCVCLDDTHPGRFKAARFNEVNGKFECFRPGYSLATITYFTHYCVIPDFTEWKIPTPSWAQQPKGDNT